MPAYDVFNGDADGICALVQMRRAEPRESVLVTGVKRDIGLLSRVPAAAGDEILVLDVSYDVNRDAARAALEAGARIVYFDHHFAGAVPRHPALSAHIDTAPDTCTSLLVDTFLGGRYAAWAVTAAFGDNLDDSARARGSRAGLDAADLERLRQLGICINYNGYGASPADLHFAPDDLYRRLARFDDPREFLAADAGTFDALLTGYRDDLERAASATMLLDTPRAAAWLLPAEPWSRRVSGVFANQLAAQAPHRAHAIVTELENGALLVSVRAPIADRRGADTLCRAFPTGGGRAAAAGINALPGDQLNEFLDALARHW